MYLTKIISTRGGEYEYRNRNKDKNIRPGVHSYFRRTDRNLFLDFHSNDSAVYISVGPVPFTLQTFGVFMAVGVLGGKRGSLAVLVYILLGAIGVPVFAGFSGGLGILLNNTGGYIIGFLFSALVMWAMESLWGKKPVIQILSMVVGLIVCYAMGTIWFMVYTRTSGAVGLGTVLGWCVIPFIIPDLVKIALAFVLSRRVRKLVPMQ